MTEPLPTERVAQKLVESQEPCVLGIDEAGRGCVLGESYSFVKKRKQDRPLFVFIFALFLILPAPLYIVVDGLNLQ
jgi:hypothetical protein